MTLNRNRLKLQESGIAVPYSILGDSGFHELPWSIKKWDLRFLNSEAINQNPSAIIRQVVESALESNCSTLIVSAEDLSLMTATEWTYIFQEFKTALQTRNPPRFTITYTDRSITELVPAAYGTLVCLGFSGHYRDVIIALTDHFKKTFDLFIGIPENHESVDILQVKYSHQSFVSSWLRQVFPELDQTHLDTSNAIYNESLSVKRLEEIRELNERLALPFDSEALFDWPEAHSAQTFNQLKELLQSVINKAPG